MNEDTVYNPARGFIYAMMVGAAFWSGLILLIK